MNLPDNHTFRCRLRDATDPGLIISHGILEMPDDTDEPAVVIEWCGEGLTQIFIHDRCMEVHNDAS